MLPVPCLALVTDRRLCPPGSLADRVERAIAGGVDLVQLREKDLPAGELMALARELRRVTRGRALLLVNDRVDVALACEADGVQLGEAGVPANVARKLMGPELLIGRSVHGEAGARQAEADGADFLVVGTIFPAGRTRRAGRPVSASWAGSARRRVFLCWASAASRQKTSHRSWRRAPMARRSSPPSWGLPIPDRQPPT